MRPIASVLAAVVAFGTTLVLSAASFQTSAPQAPAPASRQPQLASLPVAALLAESEKLRLAAKLDDAHAKVDQALALAEKGDDKVGIAMAHRMRGSLFNEAGKTVDGLPWLERALSEFDALGNRRGVADVLASMTNAAVAERQIAKALDLAARALAVLDETGDLRGRARLLVNLLGLDLTVELKERYRKEVETIAERLDDDSLRADVVMGQGNRQFAAGNLAAAQTSFEQAAALFKRLGNQPREAAAYISLGRVLRSHSDWEGALREYQRGVQVLESTGNLFALVQAINSTAIALSSLDRPRESMAAMERGLALARESKNPALIDFMQGNMAGNLLAEHEWQRAAQLLEEVLSRKPIPYIASFRHGQFATALHGLGRTSEALEHQTEAVRITRELGLVDYLDNRLAFRAMLLSSLDRFDEARTDLEAALFVIDGVRAKLVPTDFLKRGYAQRVEPIYAQLVDLLDRSGQGAEAFTTSEQGRARAFLDLLAAREAPEATLATRGDQAARPRATSLQSSSLSKPLSVAEIGGVATRLQSTILTYWVGDKSTIAWVIGPDGKPSTTSLPISRDRLTQLVSSTTALLRPVATPAAKPTPVQARPVAEPAALPLRGLGLLSLAKDDRSAWRDLYDALIAPVRARLPQSGGRVTIVPHGPLFQLAFAALQKRDGQYLVEEFDLHYAPAASALDFTSRRQETVRSGTQGPWALVGNPTALPDVNGRQLAPLPGAAREISLIAALAPQGRVVRLDAAGATETALGRALDASRPSVLHFATHGFVFDDPKTPPFLVMNRGGDTPAEDGRLTLDEVYGLSLTSDLVVLSACRTGTGPVSSDGILGFTRGFFYAGTPSVLATHWDVPDITTAVLMPRFYRGYATAREKSKSLRAAQLALIADLRAGRIVVTASGRRVRLPEHPLLWAGFFLSGEP